MFESFVGKTIESVECSCVNYVKFHFTDGSSQGIFADCGTSRYSIPFFEFESESESNTIETKE